MTDIYYLDGRGLLGNEITQIHEDINLTDKYTKPVDNTDYDILIPAPINTHKNIVGFLTYYESNKLDENKDLDLVIQRKTILDRAINNFISDLNTRFDRFNESIVNTTDDPKFNNQNVIDWQILNEYKIIFASILDTIKNNTALTTMENVFSQVETVPNTSS